MSTNTAIIIGRITRDLELKKTASGKSVLSFTLAVNRTYKKEGQPEADFINCVAWNQTADFMANYLGKGNLISVEGRIQTRSYEGEDGKKVYITEIVSNAVQALESRAQRERGESPEYQASYGEYQEDAEPILDITSDDLPF